MDFPIHNGITLPSVPPEWNLQMDFQRSEAARLLRLRNEQGSILSISRDGQWLRAEIHFDAKDVPIVLRAELPDIDVVSLLIANSKSRIALYVNGQLGDEDWTLGSVPLAGCVCAEGALEAVISDNFSVEKRSLRDIHPAPVTNIQNWSPSHSPAVLLTRITFWGCVLLGFIIGLWADGFEKLQIIPLLIVTPLTFSGRTAVPLALTPM